MDRLDIYIRRLALSLMLLLSVAASSWGDSYDPDPFDDTPPVVTVELNYLKPQVMTTPAVHEQSAKLIVSSFPVLAAPQLETVGVPVSVMTQWSPRTETPLFAPFRT